MSGLIPIAVNVAARIVGGLHSILSRPLQRWWKRGKISPASGEKLAVLVAKLGGDAANSTHHSIREAISLAMPEVSVIGWPEELPIGDGLDETAQLVSRDKAKKWMKSQDCHLLISGRMKSANVVSLRFTPLETEANSAKELLRGPQTYALPVETMDFPAKLLHDVAAALAACVIANVHRYKNDGFTPALERLAPQITRIIDTDASVIDVRTMARLMNCCAIARGILFDHKGNRSDLEAAVEMSKKASSLLDRKKFPKDWCRNRSNYGLISARLGSVSHDVSLLERGAEAIREVLPEQSHDLLSWTKLQLTLAFIYTRLFRLNGSLSDLQRALDVYGQIISDELRERDSIIWGGANHQYGSALVNLSELRTDDNALAGAMEAFAHTLEVWTPNLPKLRALGLISLASALISLAGRQNNLDWYADAVTRLDEAKGLVSERQDSRIWFTVQADLGFALSMMGEQNSSQLDRAITILRDANGKVSQQDIELSSTIGLHLARALMLKGETTEDTALLRESVTILETLRQTDNLSVRNDAVLLLGTVCRTLGKLTDNQGLVRKSQGLLQEMLTQIESTQSPFLFFRTQQNLGVTMKELGVLSDSIELLEIAVKVLSEGLKFASKETSPSSWAGVQFRLAEAYFEICRRTSASSDLQNAQLAIENALSAMDPRNTSPLSDAVRQLGGRLEEFRQDLNGAYPQA